MCQVSFFGVFTFRPNHIVAHSLSGVQVPKILPRILFPGGYVSKCKSAIPRHRHPSFPNTKHQQYDDQSLIVSSLRERHSGNH